MSASLPAQASPVRPFGAYLSQDRAASLLWCSVSAAEPLLRLRYAHLPPVNKFAGGKIIFQPDAADVLLVNTVMIDKGRGSQDEERDLFQDEVDDLKIQKSHRPSVIIESVGRKRAVACAFARIDYSAWSRSIQASVCPFITLAPCLAAISTSLPPMAAGMGWISPHGVWM